MKVVIIGNGVAGISTARHLRKLDSEVEILVISGESKHFYSRPALMYIFMGHMKYQHTKVYEDWFWEKNRIDLKQAWVNDIDWSQKLLRFVNGETEAFDKLVLATGSKTATYDWLGLDLKGVQGFIGLEDLALLEQNIADARKAVIVGGGLIGVELAEMIASRGLQVEMLIREDHFWGNVLPKEEAKLVERHLVEHGIQLRFKTELREILGKEGRATGVKTSASEVIECELVCIATGVRPNILLAAKAGVACNRGLLVDAHLRTSVEDVYAAGDCVEFSSPIEGRYNIEQMWYTGKIMGEQLASTILGRATVYNPGVYFNSAKFFDLEYQIYGRVNRDSKDSFYWEHPKGKICLRLEHKDQKLVAINALGIHLRHQVADQWIRESRSLTYCLSRFNDIVFDPEFFRNHAKAIASAYGEQFGTELKLERKSWKRILNAFAS